MNRNPPTSYRPRKDRWILWAIDPFAPDQKLQRETARALVALSRLQKARVLPVYVLGTPVKGIPSSIQVKWFEETRQACQLGLERIVRGLNLDALEPVTLIECEGFAVRQSVKALLDYARRTRPWMIVASTRARKGPSRWFVGSFAETLSLKSEIPIFLVNPSWRRQTDFKEILVPTDFSETSYKAFQEVLEFAKQSGSRVNLFHKYQYLIFPIFDLGYAGAAFFPDQEKDNIRYVGSLGAQWVEEGRRAGVPMTFQLDTKAGSNPADAILRRCKRGACMIAIAPETGPLDTALGGSVSRRLIRESTAPIWVIHPQALPKRVARGGKRPQPNVLPHTRQPGPPQLHS